MHNRHTPQTLETVNLPPTGRRAKFYHILYKFFPYDLQDYGFIISQFRTVAYNTEMSLIPPPQPIQAVRVSKLSQEAGPTVVNRQLREIFREAFDQLGGAQWLVEFAQSEPANARVFVQAISKLLPASANPTTDNNKIIIDIPWLTRDRLAYKEGAVDNDVEDLLPKVVRQ